MRRRHQTISGVLPFPDELVISFAPKRSIRGPECAAESQRKCASNAMRSGSRIAPNARDRSPRSGSAFFDSGIVE